MANDQHIQHHLIIERDSHVTSAFKRRTSPIWVMYLVILHGLIEMPEDMRRSQLHFQQSLDFGRVNKMGFFAHSIPYIPLCKAWPFPASASQVKMFDRRNSILYDRWCPVVPVKELQLKAIVSKESQADKLLHKLLGAISHNWGHEVRLRADYIIWFRMIHLVSAF